MKSFLSVFLCLLLVSASFADIVTLTITVTDLPSDSETITINSDVRTWKTSVAIPASQILIGADIGFTKTNLYNHFRGNGFTGPLTLLQSGTTIVKLLSQEGQTITASTSPGWATLVLTTNTTVTATAVRVPLSVESATVRTNVASLLMAGLNAYSQTNIVSALLPRNITGLTSVEVAGTVTDPGIRISSNSGFYEVGSGIIGVTYLSSQLGVFGNPSQNFLLSAGASAGPAIQNESATSTNPTLLPNADDTDTGIGWNSENILSLIAGGVEEGQLSSSGLTLTTALAVAQGGTGSTSASAARTALGLGTISTQAASSVAITGGTASALVLTSAVNNGNPFESYGAGGSTSFEAGNSADASAANTVSIGQGSTASAARATSIGNAATSAYADSTALGDAATTTAINQIRLGTSAEEISIPGDANIAGNLAMNSDNATFPTSLDGGIYLLSGTSATADPGGGFAIWAASGVPVYRSSASSEGAGGTQYLHNRSAASVSIGTANLTTTMGQLSFSTTTPAVTLPTAGTYLINYFVQITSGVGVDDTMNFKLYDNTAAADVSNTAVSISNIDSAKQGAVHMSCLYTVSASATIHLYGQNQTVTRGTAAAGSKILYMRMY